ncbi:MAG TPA: nitrilase-related carbon-nitrogen hydrolase [Anaerolineales bacterium]|nr:nitrilase-related carbon-nitrogen hydrolase [Anaerolineales bacterium]
MNNIRLKDLARPHLHQYGHARDRGNILGIEPYMLPLDYQSQESLSNKLEAYLLAAQHEGWLNEKTIVLFPEYIGTWLILINESRKIFEAPTLAIAQRALVLHHFLAFGIHFLKTREKGRAEAAIFRMKAEQMAESYQMVFSQLAQHYSVTIVAGSIILPAPRISDGRLVSNRGPLRNVSIVCKPDGTLHSQPIYKAFPTSRELPFISPAPVSDIPSFDTPAGRLGVLICADSWFPQAHARLNEQGIELLAVPSYEALEPRLWDRPWPGYDGWQAPADVDIDDIRNITEGQAWEKYSLAGRIRSSGASYGMNIFLRGKLWDQDLGGKPATLVRDHEVFVEKSTQQAAILNLWL